ncbi:hypothetical protein F383_39240 [Gossypium arboreum]|uniref:Uncharacterized protein n=1 Tax=Gossypium arboreum TaxID=29729 RepID=A0A0B0M9S8_GOSAR|nr:hypothetical protein F383_37995 [Gossypium arboreum]KHF99216.1 hypothetical protein F383_38166 [Gossypium arboreum]KHG01367.1 hypothetical protein F383_39240 [Gossypium arboreum]
MPRLHILIHVTWC